MHVEIPANLFVLERLAQLIRWMEERHTLRPLFANRTGDHREPADMMTLFALTSTSLLTFNSTGPSTPPFLFLDVHKPLIPTAVFFPFFSSNNTFATSSPSINWAPALAASGNQQTVGPCFSQLEQPSVQCPQ
jgi:hypothetical protein